MKLISATSVDPRRWRHNLSVFVHQHDSLFPPRRSHKSWLLCSTKTCETSLSGAFSTGKVRVTSACADKLSKNADPYNFVLQFQPSEIDDLVSRRLTNVDQDKAFQAGRNIANGNYGSGQSERYRRVEDGGSTSYTGNVVSRPEHRHRN